MNQLHLRQLNFCNEVNNFDFKSLNDFKKEEDFKYQ